MADRLDLLTVSIATRNRPDVVNATLRRLHEFGLGDAEVIVCDDGSDPPLVCPALALFPRGRLLRNDASTGQALARNRIVRESRGECILQLDDDSFPVAGDVDALLAEAGSTTDWIAIAIPFDEPGRGRRFRAAAPRPPLVKAFVGCSALVHRQRMLAMDGYAPWIGRMVEEDELCMRAWGQHLVTKTTGALHVRHDATPEQRNSDTVASLCFRNWLWTCARLVPMPIVVVRLGRLAAAALWASATTGRTGPLKGLLHGLAGLPAHWQERNPLSMPEYRRYVDLPHALDMLEPVTDKRRPRPAPESP